MNTAGLRQYDFAVFIFAGNPVRIFRDQITVFRIEHLYEWKPGSMTYLLFVKIQKFAKIIAQA